MNKLARIIMASCAGNAVEFYSLTLYGSLVFKIGEVFFPDNPHQMILSLAVFGCSYIARPLGGFLLGRIGDQYGRTKVLQWSIGLVGLCNLTVAFLPGYATLGFASIILLFLCRFIQGMCVGAEYSGALTFGQEHVEEEQKTIVGSWISASCFWGFAGGVLFAQTIAYMPSWWWRIGFILSGLFTFIALRMRQNIGETPEFIAQKPHKNKKVFDWKESFRVFLLSCMDGSATYTLGGFMLIYMVEYIHMDKTFVMRMFLFFLILTGFICLAVGWLARYCQPLKMIRYALWSGAALVPFCFDWVSEHPSFKSVAVLFLSLSLIAGVFVGLAPIIMYRCVPVGRRMATIAVGYNLGQGLTGGLLPIIYAFAIDKTGILSIPGHILGVLCFVLLYGAKSLSRYMRNMMPL